jgi:hypothetical protein
VKKNDMFDFLDTFMGSSDDACIDKDVSHADSSIKWLHLILYDSILSLV